MCRLRPAIETVAPDARNDDAQLSGSVYVRATSRSFTKLASVSAAVDLSFGKAQHDGNYPALYLAGTAGADAGILRSNDAGTTWVRIDDDAHQFGFISHLSGDPRVYGRVYLGTGGRGIIYGDARDQ